MTANEYNNNDYEKRTNSRSSKGHCFKCGAESGRLAMINHAADERRDFGKDEECLILEITSDDAKGYWMIVEASMDAKLSDLDAFLRAAWMECCHHLSMFCSRDDKPFRGNKYNLFLKISSFKKDHVFTYLYDFDNSSTAEVKITKKSKREKRRGAIRLIARNDPMYPHCEICGADAAFVKRSDAGVTEYTAICKKCMRGRKDKKSYAPFANSPRMGMCEFKGEFDDFNYAKGKEMPESELMSEKRYKDWYAFEE